MIGILVITHGDLGAAFLRAAEIIAGPQEQVAAVAVEQSDDMPSTAARLAEAFDAINSGDGVIILTDLLGGTPSNVSLTLLNKKDVEVISGVNLPMLLKALTSRGSMPLREVVESSFRRGRDGITAASLLLEGKEKDSR